MTHAVPISDEARRAAFPWLEAEPVPTPAAPAPVTRRVLSSPRTVRARLALFAIGYQPVRLSENSAPVPSVTDLDDVTVERLLAAASKGVARGGYVIALTPTWLTDPARRRLQTARAALGCPRFVVSTSPLPPLAGALLAALAGIAARRVRYAGGLLAAMARLESALVPVTWLDSVARLRHPAPPIGPRLASLLPGTAFAVTSDPVPSLRRIGRRTALSLAPRRRPTLLAVSASSERGRSWVRDQLAPNLGGTTLVETPLTPLGPAYWGTHQVAEAVAFPRDVQGAVAGVVAGLVDSICVWCGEAIASEQCPFCRMQQSIPRGRGETR